MLRLIVDVICQAKGKFLLLKYEHFLYDMPLYNKVGRIKVVTLDSLIMASPFPQIL